MRYAGDIQIGYRKVSYPGSAFQGVASSSPAAKLTGLVAALLEPLIPGAALEATATVGAPPKRKFSNHQLQLKRSRF